MTRHKRVLCGCWLPLFLILISGGCSKPSAPAGKPGTAVVPVADGAAEDKTVLAVSKAIRANGLTSLDNECLAYRFDAAGNAADYLVEVRENHRYAKCGGDPAVSPRLFSVKISKTDGSMSTDRGSALGEFHPLTN